MSYLSRIRAGKYSDSDVVAFYIDKRFECGPFIREVGDFIAHRLRDKGDSFNVILGAYSQLAFWQRYQSKSGRLIEPIGECEWWLKPYFMWKVNLYTAAELKKNLGAPKEELRKKIDSWFPSRERFPTRIEALKPFEFLDVANFFSSSMFNRPAFSKSAVTKELRLYFQKMEIPFECCDDFLIATLVVLNGREFDFSNGVTGTLELKVSKMRHTRVTGGDPGLLKHGGFMAIFHPDGPLELFASTKSPRDSGLVDVGLLILDTEIDTARYFNRELVDYDQPARPLLKLDRALKFESFQSPPVSLCC